MAILKKRTSSRQLPEARGIDRAPLSSIISGGNAPSIYDTSNRPITTPTGSRPAITTPANTTTKPAITTPTTGAPKQTLTSTTGATTKPSITTSTTKPAITTNKPTTSITTPTPALKPAIKPTTTNTNSTSNKVVNALTGAALGAGAKLIIDKITGKPTVVNPPATPSKPAAKPVTKPVTPTKPTPNKPVTSVVTPPVDTKPVYETPLAPGGGAPYDDNGNLMPGWQLDENNNPVWVGVDSVDSTVAPLKPDEVAAVTPDAPFEPKYFDDGQGNIYVSTADGGYELYRAAEVAQDVAPETWTDPQTGDIWALDAKGEWNLQTAGNQDNSQDAANAEVITYTDPDTGALWTLGANGSWTTDYVAPDVPVVTDEEVPVVNEKILPIEEEKAGGLITMMKNGGGIHMATGGLPKGAVDNGDGTYTVGNDVFDMMTDEPLYSMDDSGNIISVEPTAYAANPKTGALNVEPSAITSTGGGERSWYDNLGSGLSKGFQNLTGVSDATLAKITGALPAAGAGALFATLLGSDFGGNGNQNQGLDMSKVGLINPRTTDFGVGPTNFVGYDQYGTDAGGYTPNAELLKNLNAPGYNPVNEGDYGYEDAPVQKKASGGLSSMASPVASYYTFGQPADIMANLGMRPQPPMNPPDMMAQVGQQQPAQQAQQQGLPQQSPPMAQQQMSPTMPQQGIPQNGMMPQQQGMAPPMRKGGLPHISNVPMTEGRMDFRQGSAVHGEGDGQSDDIPAMLADGEYVIDAETVAQIGNGSTKAGAQALDRFREGIRAHKRSAPLNKIPPKTKALTSYLKGAK